MSLIYQALKQSERQSAGSLAPMARRAEAAATGGTQPSPALRSRIGLGVLIAVAGAVAGYLFNPGFGAPETELASPTKAAYSTGVAADVVEPTVRVMAGIERTSFLPQADLPLPAGTPRLPRVVALAPEEKKTLEPEPSAEGPQAATATATATATVAAAQPVSIKTVATQARPVEPTVAMPTPIAEAPAAQPSTEDARALFQALNQALERQDNALALSKLQGIQAMLPESSVARLRAESWFAHQTGDLDSASHIYGRLLAKMPGDELASVNLASIEKKRQRPEQANAVLAKAYRQNPSSVVLRAAIDQLAKSEVRP